MNMLRSFCKAKHLLVLSEPRFSLVPTLLAVPKAVPVSQSKMKTIEFAVAEGSWPKVVSSGEGVL